MTCDVTDGAAKERALGLPLAASQRPAAHSAPHAVAIAPHAVVIAASGHGPSLSRPQRSRACPWSVCSVALGVRSSACAVRCARPPPPTFRPSLNRPTPRHTRPTAGAIFGLFSVAVLGRLSWNVKRLLESVVLGWFVVRQVRGGRGQGVQARGRASGQGETAAWRLRAAGQ